MKKEWVKPEIRFTTDPDIILGCLYEVYGQEKKSVLAALAAGAVSVSSTNQKVWMM